MTKTIWGRRGVLLSVAVTGLLAWLPALPFTARRVSQAEVAILSVLRHQNSAAAIGRLSLAALPEMRNREALLADIANDLEMSLSDLAMTDGDMIRTRLTARMESDFAAERTVKLDGWLLSLAEARLCALAALA